MIDVHTHFVPEQFPKLSKHPDRFPQTRAVNESSSNIFIGGKLFRTIPDRCWNMYLRMEDMDQESVDIQVLSPMPALLSYELEAEETLELSHFIHEQLQRMIHCAPERYYGLGMVPLQNPELAASALLEAKKKYGIVGVEVGSNVRGKPIGHPDFLPFFEAAESSGMVILIHPVQPIGSERLIGPPNLNEIVNFPMETAYAILSLIMGGILDRCPNLKIIISHGGGSFISILPRLMHGWHVFEQLRDALPKNPISYLDQLYFDTIVYDKRTLSHLTEWFGCSRLLVGTDYPFVLREKEPGKKIASLNVKREQKNLILSQNASRLFK